MMTPELRSIASVDVDDLETWRSDDAALWVILDLEIGPLGERGADVFNLYVCSPQALRDIVAENGVQDGRHLLIVDEFDYPRIRTWIDSVLERSVGASWDEVAGKLSRYLEWEFEDYRTDPGRGLSAAGNDTDRGSPTAVEKRISGEPDA